MSSRICTEMPARPRARGAGFYAGALSGSAQITAGGALALALGIAIQNFPEGAIISMPLHAEGTGKGKSFLYGVLSGAVEPVFGLMTVLAAGLIVPAMPYFLSFAAGAMLYVVVEELIPEAHLGDSHIGTLGVMAITPSSLAISTSWSVLNALGFIARDIR